MMRSAFLMAALASCYSPTPPSGSPCDPVTPNCPSGQSCTESGGAFYCLRPGEAIDSGTGVLDEGIDDASVDMPSDASNDRDSDTINNADDNCPDTPNTDQLNDDSDKFGDACDFCPPIADPASPDNPDGDDVWGRCDPNPTQAGDRIVGFHTFASLPPNVAVTGTVTLDPANGGGIAMAAPEGASATLTIPEPPGNNVTVMTAVTYTSIALAPGSTNISGSGPLLRKSAAADTGIVCANITDVNLNRSLVLSNLSPPAVFASTTEFQAALDKHYLMSITRSAAAYRCSTSLLADANATTIMGNYQLQQAEGRVGVRVQAGSATFEWMLVLAR